MKTKFQTILGVLFVFSLIISACSPASQGQATAADRQAAGNTEANATEVPTATATEEPANLVIGLDTLSQLHQFWKVEFVGDPDAEYGCEWQMLPCTYVSSITAYAFSPDGNTLAVGVCLGVRTVDRTQKDADIWGCTGESAVILYDSITGNERGRLATAALPFSIAFHPDGATLAIGLGSSDIEIWDLSRNDLVSTLPGTEKHVGAYPLTFVLNGSQLLAGSGPGQVTISATTGRSLVGGSISVWDWRASEILKTIVGVYGISITPDGGSLVTHTVNNPDGILSDTVRVYDLNNLDNFTEFLPEGQIQPSNIYINPRNGWIATVESGFDANLANFWDPQSYELVDSFAWDEGFDERGFLYDLKSGGFTSDGYFLLGQEGPSAGPATDDNGQELEECSFALADIQANQIYFVSDPMTPEECNANYVYAGTRTLVLSPDGRFIAGESGNGVLKLWGIDASLPALEPACYGEC